jgi:RNA polymerase sigma factor (sigma-70 family)
MSPPPPHDDDRCDRLYRLCRAPCLVFARRLLAPSYGRNRYLCAFDAEEFYDAAWETYYSQREYLDDHDDHVRRINTLILSRVRDAWRRGGAHKRQGLDRSVGIDQAEHLVSQVGVTTNGTDDRVADRDQLQRLLARVRNPDDTRALVDHEVEGLTYEDIADREGISPEAARRRALRAKQQARARPEEDA